eukprot:TRINITY_DN2360_c1_g1_i2.p1 TRINITY_DN2360_c1_g1~~TRINITY_DN2360_c1_g1_i2.p1  ORF type:complete len:256 (+),score=61.67 TRINITY_DN2360_c1_g1_i2:328-1095(+)
MKELPPPYEGGGTEWPWVLARTKPPTSEPAAVSRELLRCFQYDASYHRGGGVWVPSFAALLRRDPAFFRRLPVPPAERLPGASIVWWQRDTAWSGVHDSFVAELGALASIDVVVPGAAPVEFMQQHKFMLIVDDAPCMDYVPDEFWIALSFGLVPVVLGAPNIEEFAPAENSIVNAAKFASARALWEHLQALAGDPARFSDYLSYKHDRSLLRPAFVRMLSEYCEPEALLCNLLVSHQQRKPLEPDLSCLIPACE